jgi:hypothetical protein
MAHVSYWIQAIRFCDYEYLKYIVKDSFRSDNNQVNNDIKPVYFCFIQSLNLNLVFLFVCCTVCMNAEQGNFSPQFKQHSWHTFYTKFEINLSFN